MRKLAIPNRNHNRASLLHETDLSRAHNPLRATQKGQRVQYALAVIEGQRPFPKLSKAMIARACGVSPSSIYRRQKHNRDITNAEIDRFVAMAGADRVLAALDRLTQPQFVLAAE